MRLKSVLLLFLQLCFIVQQYSSASSMDLWIESIPPRCLINFIYFRNTNDLSFNSSKKIPLTLIPLDQNTTKEYWDHHKFANLSLKHQKAFCFFNIMYYRRFATVPQQNEYNVSFKFWMDFTYSLLRPFYPSNKTFTLLLYDTRKGGYYSMLKELARYYYGPQFSLIYLSRRPTDKYHAWCKSNGIMHPPIFVTTATVSNLINACPTREQFRVQLTSRTHVKFREDLELEIVRSILRRVNSTFFVVNVNGFWFGEPLIRTDDGYAVNMRNSFFKVFGNFVRIFTCYSTPVMSFHFYTSAFDKIVWSLIVLSGLIISAFLSTLLCYKIQGVKSFSPLLFYFSIFVEETYSIPSRIRNNQIYRMATCLWLLSAIVVTNIFISHVISGLNAPLPGQKLETIHDISTKGEISKEIFKRYNRRQFESVRSNYTRFFNLFDYNHSDEIDRPFNGFSVLSEPLNLPHLQNVWLHASNPYLYKILHDVSSMLELCKPEKTPTFSHCRTLLKLMTSSFRHNPSAHEHKRPWKDSEYAREVVEEELANCEKSIYLERSDQLEFKYMSNHYPKKKFYYLKEGFASRFEVWVFENMQRLRIPALFGYMLESGIYHQLHKLSIVKQQLKRIRVTDEILNRINKPITLDMTSSVQTVFIIYSAMALLAIISFLSEVLRGNFSKRKLLILVKKSWKVCNQFSYKFCHPNFIFKT